MESTPESIKEAQRALAQYMEMERRRQQQGEYVHRSEIEAGASFHVEDEAQHVPDSPTQHAADYAKARNQNLRPLRQLDETDENAREGRDSALAYLERRRRSVIRK
jgi:hypothetical protein